MFYFDIIPNDIKKIIINLIEPFDISNLSSLTGINFNDKYWIDKIRHDINCSSFIESDLECINVPLDFVICNYGNIMKEYLKYLLPSMCFIVLDDTILSKFLHIRCVEGHLNINKKIFGCYLSYYSKDINSENEIILKLDPNLCYRLILLHLINKMINS